MKTIAQDINLQAHEMCFIQYMPIGVPGSDRDRPRLPSSLTWVKPMMDVLVPFMDIETYIYLTVRHFWVGGGNPGTRPGWHIDGYLSEDQNYIWCDRNPTEVSLTSIEDFGDEATALDAMTQVANNNPVTEIQLKSVIDIGRTLHRANPVISEGMRTFVKVTTSRHRYNLIGNSTNPILAHDWRMYPRGANRNHPYVID